MVTATILVDTNGEREYISCAIRDMPTNTDWEVERVRFVCYRNKSGDGTRMAGERESTFRELSFDLLTGLDNKFRVEVKLIFEVLPTTEPFVPFFSLKESQHVKV